MSHAAPLLVRLDEAAEMLGLSERTVHRLVAEGRLPSLKVGRRRLFSPRRLQEWAEAQAAVLPPPAAGIERSAG